MRVAEVVKAGRQLRFAVDFAVRSVMRSSRARRCAVMSRATWTLVSAGKMLIWNAFMKTGDSRIRTSEWMLNFSSWWPAYGALLCVGSLASIHAKHESEASDPEGIPSATATQRSTGNNLEHWTRQTSFIQSAWFETCNSPPRSCAKPAGPSPSPLQKDTCGHRPTQELS